MCNPILSGGPSIHPTIMQTTSSSLGLRGSGSLSQLTAGERQGTHPAQLAHPLQSTHHTPFTHPLKPTGNFEVSNLLEMQVFGLRKESKGNQWEHGQIIWIPHRGPKPHLLAMSATVLPTAPPPKVVVVNLIANFPLMQDHQKRKETHRWERKRYSLEITWKIGSWTRTLIFHTQLTSNQVFLYNNDKTYISNIKEKEWNKILH